MAENRKIILLTLPCLFTLLLCFFTLAHFVLFLSHHTSLKYFNKYNSDLKDDSVFVLIITDLFILSLFVLQHSIQANNKIIKGMLHSLGLDVFERLLYNFVSCVTLQVLMRYWQCIPSVTLWEISTSDNTILWWFFTIIHFVSWLITYSACFIMDVGELLGVKQVYHHIFGWPQPLVQKSEGLKRFYSHMRHPGFSALIVIVFIHPVMQLDRLLLAYAFMLYMFARFRVDDVDYAYQRRMLQRKYRDLSLSNGS